MFISNAINLGSFWRKVMCVAVACASLFTAPVAVAASTDDASKYVETIGNNAVATLSDKKLSKSAKSQKLEQLFRKNVDTAWIGRFVLGRFWRQATDDQKKRYFSEYENFLVRQYATRFTDYSGGSFVITSSKDEGDNEFLIAMQIKSNEPNGKPVLVDYKVRSDGKDGFLVFDIIVEGVSMIATQRSEFTSVITNKGMDYLISQLASKSNTFGNGNR